MTEIAEIKDKVERQLGLRLLQKMILIRRFEEKSAEMYTLEKIRGFLHLYIGEEAVAVGVIEHLQSDDIILATYREHGHALARGIESKIIMAEMYGKIEGCCKGRGGSMHLFDVNKNFIGGNAIVAGHLAMAVGMALASKKQKKKNITCCFFGEGATAEGDFHEAMNLAALWDVPLLMVCENNLYAMGTGIRFELAQFDFSKKSAAYGIESLVVNGMDVLEVSKGARYALEKIKDTGKPFFLICDTYRFRAHSMFDAELYREKGEVEEWKKKDPILNLKNRLVSENTINEIEIKDIESKVENEIKAAIAFAEEGKWEPKDDLTKYLLSE